MVVADKILSCLRGIILGTAVGDALGLPSEGLKPETIKKLGWSDLRHRFLFGRGMISDDTEHTFFVAQALLKCPDDPDKFSKSLASKLKWWLVSLPAGTGMATARAIIKLWLGFSPGKSGVFSAGNGPAMRSAIIGARFFDDPEKMREYVRRSTVITHTDPKAFTAAYAVALYAAEAASIKEGGRFDRERYLEKLFSIPEKSDPEWDKAISNIKAALIKGMSLHDFAHSLGFTKGVSGYAYHTVPIAIYACLRYQGDFTAALTQVVRLGGDTDTVGAIVGAMSGAIVGEEGIPREWIKGIKDWPRSVKVLKEAADRLAASTHGRDVKPVCYFIPGILIRNIIFFIVVLLHGFARLLPASFRRTLD